MKELVVYKIDKTIPEFNIELMEQNKFKECDKLQQLSIGFSMNENEEFVDNLDSETKVLYITTQTKKPSTAEVNRRLKEESKKYFTEFRTYPNKETKDSLKQEITSNLLPLTFADEPKTSCVIVTDNMVYITDANYKRAEDILAFLRQTLGSFPVVQLDTVKSPSEVLTRFISSQINETITLGSKAVLLTAEERKVQVSKGSLYNSEAQVIVDDGAMAQSVEIVYDSVTTATVCEDLSIKGIKFSKDLGLDEAGSKLTTMIIEFSEVKNMFEDLIKEMGGFSA
jgi:recombination associated protein RdgC